VDENIVIEIKNLTKNYKLYNNHSDRVKEAFHPFRKKFHHIFSALNDISFDVKKGETLGIVGRNGSGKSTLLQILCGILNPTSGLAEIKGKVSALLELGAGFNPEFTGRQNVFINGAILGLANKEMEACFDDIAEFAELGDFIDQPVKTYSSGMYVRLAFAVAIHVNADILIVDEALAVGDEIFQRKCFSRIQQLQQKGTTILFVSHSAGQVVELCNRAILLDQGELLLDGTPKQVVSEYHKLIFAGEEKADSLREEIRALKSGNNIFSQPGEGVQEIEHTPALCAFYEPSLVSKSMISYNSRGVRISDVRITTPDSDIVNVLVRRHEYLYTYKANFQKTAYNIRFGMLIKTVSGVELGGSASSLIKDAVPYIEAGATVSVKFSFKCLLQPGTYFFNCGVLGLIDGTEVYLHRIIDAVVFRVQTEDDFLSTGMIDFYAEMKTCEVLKTSQVL